MRWQMCDNKEGSFTSPFVEMAEKAPRPPHICQDCPVALVSRALADGKLSKIQGSQIQGCTCKARYVSLTAPLPRLHPASRESAAANVSAQMVHALLAINRRRQPDLARLDLQSQDERIEARLLQVAAVEPQRLLLRRLPHVT